MKAHRLSSNTRWKFYTFIVLQLQQLLLEKSKSKNKKESGYGPFEKLCVLKKSIRLLCGNFFGRFSIGKPHCTLIILGYEKH